MNNILTNTPIQNFENLSEINNWLESSRSYTSFWGKRQITSGDLTLSLNQVVKKIEEIFIQKSLPVLVKENATLLHVNYDVGDPIYKDQENNLPQAEVAKQILIKLEILLDSSSKKLNWFKKLLLKIRELKCLNLNPQQHLTNSINLFCCLTKPHDDLGQED